MVKKSRDLALQRALKFAVLFQEETFDEVLKALRTPNIEKSLPNETKIAFDNVLHDAGIKAQEDKDWLFHYLQNMDDDKTPGKPYWKDALDVAATTGW